MVVPARHRLAVGNVTLLFQTQVILMHMDVLQQLLVAPRLGQLDQRTRADVVQLRLIEEVRIFDLDDHLIGLHSGRQLDRHINDRNPCLDVTQAVGPRDGDSVIAIAHKVDLGQLIDLDGRQVLQAVEGHVEPLPAFGIGAPQGQEVAVEVAVTSHTADDAVEPDHLRFGHLDLPAGQ